MWKTIEPRGPLALRHTAAAVVATAVKATVGVVIIIVQPYLGEPRALRITYSLSFSFDTKPV